MGIEDLPANLHRIRKAKAITQVELSRRVGISRQAYSAIEAGRSLPKTQTLLSIASSLNVPVGELIAEPASFESLRFRSRKTMSKRDLAQRDELLLRFARWLHDYRELEEALDESRPFALEGIDAFEPIGAARQCRLRLGVAPNEPVDDILGLLESAGVKVFTGDFGLSQVFGFSAGRADGGPAVAVNAASDVTIERQIFTAAHEIGHLILHSSSYGASDGEIPQAEEAEADAFAGHFLIPKRGFDKELDENQGLPLVEFVLHVKRKFRISYLTVLYRLVHEYGYSSDLYAHFRASYRRHYGKSLSGKAEPEAIEDLVASREVESLSIHDFIEGRLERLVRQAVSGHQITVSRAAEILGKTPEEMRILQTEWMTLHGRR